MHARIPEPNKIPGVRYAVTDDGLELPVIDVTHPAFACDPSPAELDAVAEATLRGWRRGRRIPAFARRWLTRRSLLARGAMDASGSYLSGITTYLYKLGAENLGAGYAGAMDRRVASSIFPIAMRLRLQAMARLLADGLAPALAARPRRPLRLINLGGGAASDSLNALLVLRAAQPELLRDRAIRIGIFDPDVAGPAFGARCLEALGEPGAPLAGMDATLERIPYDWADPRVLREWVAGGRADGAAVGGSSEGGLFEYGSDAAIGENLRVLHESAPADFALVGTVVRENRVTRTMREVGGIPLRLFPPGVLESVAGGAGWRVAREVEGNPIYRVVSLTKA
jgi:hypothetical protein